MSLDLPSDAAAAERSPDEFFRRHPPPVVIDEVQYAPGVFRHVKADIDAHRHEYGRYILTGSQKFTLMKEVADSLAGRCARQILNVSSLRDFVRLCATYNGQLLNKTELARGVGVTSKTIDQWLGVLHASNQIALLEPYIVNLGKRIVKSPKLYFCDTGLLCFLLGVDEGSLADSALLGSVWEAFVYAELRKMLAVHAPDHQLWFYRDPQGREVDLMVQGGGRFRCIECKWTELPRQEDGRWLREVAALLENAQPKPVRVDRILAARPRETYPMADGTRVLHGARLSGELFPER